MAGDLADPEHFPAGMKVGLFERQREGQRQLLPHLELHLRREPQAALADVVREAALGLPGGRVGELDQHRRLDPHILPSLLHRSLPPSRPAPPPAADG